VSAFNALYYHSRRNATGKIVDLESFFYPLDAIGHWNRMYGKRGFVQYQVALPLERGAEGLVALLQELIRSRRSPFLAVLKRFGDANPGLLSFPLKGFTFALDLPVANGLVPFLGELDQIVLRYGGRVYLAKDAVVAPGHFAAMYPRLDQFQAIKQKLDPRGVFSSSLSRRLKITAN
jgi:FAD/FMN-containing dehydrogenase